MASMRSSNQHPRPAKLRSGSAEKAICHAGKILETHIYIYIIYVGTNINHKKYKPPKSIESTNVVCFWAVFQWSCHNSFLNYLNSSFTSRCAFCRANRGVGPSLSWNVFACVLFISIAIYGLPMRRRKKYVVWSCEEFVVFTRLTFGSSLWGTPGLGFEQNHRQEMAFQMAFQKKTKPIRLSQALDAFIGGYPRL